MSLIRVSAVFHVGLAVLRFFPLAITQSKYRTSPFTNLIFRRFFYDASRALSAKFETVRPLLMITPEAKTFHPTIKGYDH
jgi:hypothetical protein